MIRHYQNSGPLFAERRWWARLSSSKQKDLDQFLQQKNRAYRVALEKLDVIPGLWGRRAVRISMLREVVASKCEEVSTLPRLCSESHQDYSGNGKLSQKRIGCVDRNF
jgi:hypothetical protein